MNPNKHLKIYKASAGAGKTHTITEQYIRMLYSYEMRPIAHQHILAVTFTNKATAEMKDRILETLHKIMSNAADKTTQDLINKLGTEYGLKHEDVCEQAGKYYTEILFSFPEFMVSTIDSFFVRIVRSCAYELGITDDYNVQIDPNEIIEQAINRVFLSLADPQNSKMLEWFKEHSIERLKNGESWNIRSALKDVKKLLVSEDYKKITRHAYPINIEDISNFVKQLGEIASQFEADMSNTAKRIMDCIKANGLTTESFNGGSRSGFGSIEKMSKGDKEEMRGGLGTKVLNAIDDHSVAAAKTSKDREKIIDLMDKELGALLSNMKECHENRAVKYKTATLILKNAPLLALLAHIEKQYRILASAGRKMMLENNGELIRRMIDGTNIPFIYEKLGTILHHYMIDEFQDTSDLQWENFRPLIAESLSKGNDNMLVGDVKQSIFRWRSSNWHLMADEIPADEALKDHIDTINSDNNWRSRKAIVEFNNRLFLHLNEICAELNSNYSDAKQNVCDKFANATPGCVTININYKENHNDDNDDDDTQEADWLVEQIMQCVERGFGYKDITILVYKNKEGAQIAQQLNERNIPVTSSNALLLSQSPAVMFLTLLMKHTINADKAVKHNLLVIYAIHALKKTEEEAILFAGDNTNTDIDSIIGLDTKILIRNAVNEMVGKIFHSLKLDEWDETTLPHLLEFIDVVEDVAPQVSYNAQKFIRWWEKNNEDLFVPMPDNDAVKILTIHKAKGLAAPVIMVPKCNSALSVIRDDIAWLPTEGLEEPFNAVPVVPIQIQSGKGTYFEDFYNKEKQERVTDAINTLYVALTRPINELYINTTIKKADITMNPKSVGELLNNFVRQSEQNEQELLQKGVITNTLKDCGIEKKELRNDNVQYTVCYGSPLASYADSATSDDGCVVANASKLQINHELIVTNTQKLDDGTYSGLNFQPHIMGMPLLDNDDDPITNIEQLPTDENKNPWLNYGLLMHELLAGMDKSSDAEQRIKTMLDNGHVTRNEATLLLNAVNEMLDIEGVKDLLDTQGQILNEHTIIGAEGKSQRPDRVVLTQDNRAIIIDYKFGTEQLNKHKQQVSQYAELLRQMGYNAEGYLIYGSLKQLLKVC